MPYFTIKHTQKKTLRKVFLFLFSRCVNQGSESQGGLSQGKWGWNQASLAVDKALSPNPAFLTRLNTHPFGEWKRKHWALLQGFHVHDGEPLRMAGLPRMGGMVYFSVGRSGAFQRCEISWPATADSTGCPERGACLDPRPPGPASSFATCRDCLGLPRLLLAERLQNDRPATRLQCLFTKHRDGPLGSPPPSRPSATSGEEGLQAHSQALHPGRLTSRD